MSFSCKAMFHKAYLWDNFTATIPSGKKLFNFISKKITEKIKILLITFLLQYQSSTAERISAQKRFFWKRNKCTFIFKLCYLNSYIYQFYFISFPSKLYKQMNKYQWHLQICNHTPTQSHNILKDLWQSLLQLQGHSINIAINTTKNQIITELGSFSPWNTHFECKLKKIKKAKHPKSQSRLTMRV